MNQKVLKYDLIKDISGLLIAIAGIIAFIKSFFGLAIFRVLFQFIIEKPEWFWLRWFTIYFCLVFASFICVWLWDHKSIFGILKNYKNQQIRLLLKLTLFFIVHVPFSILLTFIMFEDRLPNQEAEKIFPIAADLGPTYFRSYATNGVVHHAFYEDHVLFGPKKGFMKIDFRLFGFTIEHNGGWVIYLLRGVDISRYHEIRFLIRGEHGGEKIGIKAKDARGVEVQLRLEGEYLREGRINTKWQEAVVPLSHFGNVDFSLMENFSLYTTGILVGTRPQSIYVGEFELR